VERRWGSSVPLLDQIIDIENEVNKTQECVLTGMVYKDLKLRGSVSNHNRNIRICFITFLLTDPR
jgi:hypothetical protein